MASRLCRLWLEYYAFYRFFFVKFSTVHGDFIVFTLLCGLQFELMAVLDFFRRFQSILLCSGWLRFFCPFPTVNFNAFSTFNQFHGLTGSTVGVLTISPSKVEFNVAKSVFDFTSETCPTFKGDHKIILLVHCDNYFCIFLERFYGFFYYFRFGFWIFLTSYANYFLWAKNLLWTYNDSEPWTRTLGRKIF